MMVRVGLLLLIVLDGVVGFWQYFFPDSFFTDFPTSSTTPIGSWPRMSPACIVGM